jgi:hypothetical protein
VDNGTTQAVLIGADQIAFGEAAWADVTRHIAGDSDKTIAVLSFIAPDGTPIALFVNYAMHPISFYLRGLVSSDFPGEASRYIESVYGNDVVVVWTQGAQGDQKHRTVRRRSHAAPRRSTAASTAG